jgi:GPN-loop GTPase
MFSIRFTDPDVYQLANSEFSNVFLGRFSQLNKAIASVIYDYSLVKFYTLDMSKEESITDLLVEIDLSIQYGEDLDVKEPKEIEPNDQDDSPHDE